MKFDFLGEKSVSDKEKLLVLISEASSQMTINGKPYFSGRKRLVKAAFLAQYLNFEGDERKLDLDLDFSDYEFIIYNFGPFSNELVNDLQGLKGKFLEEISKTSSNKLKLTDKGQNQVKEIKEDLDEDELERISKVAGMISDKNGKEVTEMSLSLLGIAKEEKDNWMGFNVEKIIQSQEGLVDEDNSSAQSTLM